MILDLCALCFWGKNYYCSGISEIQSSIIIFDTGYSAMMKLHWAPIPIFFGNAMFKGGSLMGLLSTPVLFAD